MTLPDFLRAPLLEQINASSGCISYGFFTRHGGVSTGVYESLNGGYGSKDTSTLVSSNRHLAAEALGRTEDKIRGLHQIHSSIALIASAKDRPKGDALITSTPGLVLTVLTADCAPVLFVDPENRVIAAAHAGWRGAADGIIENTVKQMQQEGATPPHIKAVIGPCIKQASYQVGADMKAAVLEQSPWADVHFGNDNQFGDSQFGDNQFGDSKKQYFRFDLSGYILTRLEHLGIEAQAMEEDTLSDDRFFSYRSACLESAPDTGRLINMISLTP